MIMLAMKLALFVVYFLVSLFLPLSSVIAAPTPTPVERIQLNPPPQGGVPSDTSLNTLIANAITIIFTIAAVLVLVMLIWGAIQWILSAGDKDAVGNARKRITNALIGLAILALAFLIVRVVGAIVGLDILKGLDIPTLFAPPPPTPTPKP